MKTTIIFFAYLLFLSGCANQIQPSGGPVDSTTPEIIATFPSGGTRNYEENAIRIEFDRYVDERTLEESVFISPFVGSLEFDWSGTGVKIKFSKKLRENTTYVVNIGTDVKDKYRNNFNMAKAYSLAFSTGPEIDRGAIEGRVFPRNVNDAVSGIMIFAYRLDGINRDTLNPASTNPDFITQTGKNGDFFLHYLPYGEYRVFAIRDEYRNLIYEQGIDEYGVQSSAVKITSTDTCFTDLFMKLDKEDITGPSLVGATVPDRRHVVAEFSENIDPLTSVLMNYSILDTADQKSLGIVDVFPKSDAGQSFVMITQEQDSARTYKLTVNNIADSARNKINPNANSFYFQGSPKPDTMELHIISVSIKDSVKGVALSPEFNIAFSDALAKPLSLDFLDIYDIKNRTVRARKKQISDVLVSITPEKQLNNYEWYALRADLQSLKDWSGRRCRDSVRSWRFETLDIEDMGNVEGMIVGNEESCPAKRIYVTANRLGEKESNDLTTVADSSGKFDFTQITGGKYVFQAFCDRNRDGVYSAGRPFPFVYSEPLSRFSDTVKVRSRWLLEGVVVRMK